MTPEQSKQFDQRAAPWLRWAVQLRNDIGKPMSEAEIARMNNNLERKKADHFAMIESLKAAKG